MTGVGGFSGAFLIEGGGGRDGRGFLTFSVTFALSTRAEEVRTCS